ncbi:MAG: hypothetical protein AB7G48_16230 [Nitrospiraceae bacterium]
MRVAFLTSSLFQPQLRLRVCDALLLVPGWRVVVALWAIAVPVPKLPWSKSTGRARQTLLSNFLD